MRNRNRAFTLLELILVIAIGGILLAISTNWYITNVATSNNNNNRQVDLQSGVSTSLEMVKNTLKKTSQLHLVGKNVYDPELSLSALEDRKLDTNYNYIALSKDKNGNYSLINIVYNRAKSKFESFPLCAQIRNDNMKANAISYNMKLYQNDVDYKQKVKKNIVNISVSGNVHDVDRNGKHINPENDRVFELTEDIYLPNINQVLISKHLVGGLNEITAIAYDNVKIEGQQKSGKTKKMNFVFAIDNSPSMKEGMEYKGKKYGRKTIAREKIHDFIKKLNELGKEAGIQMDAYIFTWGGVTMIEKIPGAKVAGSDPNRKYIYPLDKVKQYYGPYKLGINNDYDKKEMEFEGKKLSKIEHHIDSTCNMAKYETIDGTNTSLAILQSLEILNQLMERNPDEKRFFVLMTDGEPNMHPESGGRLEKKYILKRPYSTSTYEHFDNILISIDPRKPYPQSFIPRYRSMVGDARDYYRVGKQYEKNKDGDFVEYLSDRDYRLFYGNPSGNMSSSNVSSGMPSKPLYYYDRLTAICSIKKITSAERNNNRPKTFDKAYLIGFSDKKEDKFTLGLDKNNEYDCRFSDLNYTLDLYPSQIRSEICVPYKDEKGSIRKYLALEGTKQAKSKKVEVFDAFSPSALESAFDDIIINMGSIMGVFDGPNPLRIGGSR